MQASLSSQLLVQMKRESMLHLTIVLMNEPSHSSCKNNYSNTVVNTMYYYCIVSDDKGKHHI